MANRCRGRETWWQERLRGRGCRFTFPRRIILDTLSSAANHPSAEELYLTVHKQCPSVGLTTVYRTLELLVEMGVVYKSDFGDGRARYELIESHRRKTHHHHLVCTGCGKVIDYTDFIEDEVELLKKTEKGLSKKYDFQIDDHIIQFYGLCDKCKKK
jgi:Fur family ferric uptake transcriptional regulator